MLAKETKKDKESGQRRVVSVSKLAESRVGIGLVHKGRGVVAVAEVASTSPFEGLIFPGEIISLTPVANGGLSSTRSPTPIVTADAVALSAAFFAASQLSLNVETPPLLVGAESVFLHSSELDSSLQLGIEVGKDRPSGFARIVRLTPGSIAATAAGPDALMPGDLIVAVSAGGTLYETSTVNDCYRVLKLYEAGPIELRIVRREPSLSTQALSSRPSSARTESVNAAAPPAYSSVMASQM